MNSIHLSLLCALAFLPHSVLCLGPNIFRDSKPSEHDADTYFGQEVGTKTVEGEMRIVEFEDALRGTYASLPKDAAGTLSHDAVRYVLHRLFVARNGWYIRGLEPNDHKKIASQPSDFGVENATEEWVPSYLQKLLERREHDLGEVGTNLRELSGLAAAFEDLAFQEARQRLQATYRLHRLPLDGESSAEEVANALRTYFVGFLLAGNFTAVDAEEADRKKEVFATKYTGWLQAEEWLREISKHYVPGHPDMIGYPAAESIALGIGESYYKFNDIECTDLKKALIQSEGKKAGRVRLSSFYKQALYSHWRFTEKVDYLRTLGALDESDPESPYVITVNYITSRPNCLESSGLYAICCRDECEDLMGHLERKIAEPTAKPEELLDLVANLQSDTVPAPRKLSPMLVNKLKKVAENHGGEVPIHGRLFAQWMHHAYPRECPYPHATGTTTPQTPDEWMRENGQDDSSASPEEMWGRIERDVCAVGATGGIHCKDETSELPWSEHEELLSVSVHAPMTPPPGVELQIQRAPEEIASTGINRWVIFASGVMVSCIVILGVAGFAGQKAAGRIAPACLTISGILLVYALELLDVKALVFALVGASIVFVGHVVAGRMCRPVVALPKEAKSYV